MFIPREPTSVLAVDFSGGRKAGVIGTLQDGSISLLSRTSLNLEPVLLGETLYWDFLRIFESVGQDLACSKSPWALSSVAINARGDDFGLLDSAGYLLENPVHCSDRRTQGMLEHCARRIPPARLYAVTGGVPAERGTACQLLALRESRVGLLGQAATLLPLPSLLSYFLCGSAAVDATLASTAGLLDFHSGEWSPEVIAALGLPARIFPRVVAPGTVLGGLPTAMCERHRVGPVKVIAPAGSNLQSALLAVPAAEGDFAFLYDDGDAYCELGAELAQPLRSEELRERGFATSPAFGGRFAVHGELSGRFLLGECIRHWNREISATKLADECGREPPFRSLIDPEAPVFRERGDIPARIGEFCRRTGQSLPETPAAVTRCIFESLALARRRALAALGHCTGRAFPVLYAMGAHVQEPQLAQMTADACGCRVAAGPILPGASTAALGNVAAQLLALGRLDSPAEVRRIIAASFKTPRYEPANTAAWDAAYKRFLEVSTC